MAMPVHTVVQAIQKKEFAPVYVLYGVESFLMEEFLGLLRREMIDPAYADLNVSHFDCTEVPLSTIVEDAQTLPFFADRRLVVASQAYFLTGAKVTAKVEFDPDVLIRYLADPVAYSSLVFTVNAEKLDERKKLVKQLEQQAVVVAFQPLRETELLAWIERRCKKWKMTIDRERAARLVERVGEDLRTLDKELEKFSLYLNREGAAVTDDVIGRLASRTLEQDVFALIEAVVTGRLSEAFRTLYDCLKTGEEPIRLLALISRQIRLLLHVKLWTPRGYTPQQLAGMFKVHPFAVKKAIEQARHFDEKSLRRLLSILAEEDFRMKTGQVEKTLALELFITRVAAELN